MKIDIGMATKGLTTLGCFLRLRLENNLNEKVKTKKDLQMIWDVFRDVC